MAKMKINELRDLSIEELEQKVMEVKMDLSKERALLASGTRAENPGKIKKIRRTAARLLTLINEKKKLKEKKESEKIKPIKSKEKTREGKEKIKSEKKARGEVKQKK